MGGAKSGGVASGAAVAVRQVVPAAKFAHGAVTENDVMIAGSEAAKAKGAVGVREPLSIEYSPAAEGDEIFLDDVLGGGGANQVHYEGACGLAAGFHSGEGTGSKMNDRRLRRRWIPIFPA